MKRLALLLALDGCGPLPLAQCVPGEVACGWRVLDPQRIETRCFMLCVGGEWTVQECLPNCGGGDRMEGANGTACVIADARCPAR